LENNVMCKKKIVLQHSSNGNGGSHSQKKGAEKHACILYVLGHVSQYFLHLRPSNWYM